MAVLPVCELEVTRRRDDKNRFLRYANEKRKRGHLVDITIEIGTQKISAHRMVLACYSGYFEKKFMEKGEIKSSVTISDMHEESVAKLIEYFYTMEIVINNVNIMNLLLTAMKLKVQCVIDFCLDYLQTAINIKNWFFVFKEANFHRIDSMRKIVYKFIDKNFIQVTESDDFKQLTEASISSYIANRDPLEVSDLFLYEAIIAWTEHCSENRRESFSKLFFQVNFNRLSVDYMLKVIAEENLVKVNSDCYLFLMKKLTASMMGTNLNITESKILSLGGIETGLNVKQIFSLKGSFHTYPNLPEKLNALCAQIINRKIFCIGGEILDHHERKLGDTNEENLQSVKAKQAKDNEENEDGDKYKQFTGKVWQMDLNDNVLEWTEIGAMNKKRCSMAAAVCNDFLVVSGGFDGENILASIEIYLKPLDKWHFISPMCKTRFCHSMVSCNGQLYAIGGADDQCDELSSVERLTVMNGKWELIKSMQTERVWLAAVSLKGTIFAIGGSSDFSGKNILKSVEKFDVDSMIWKYVRNLNIGRFGHSACVMNENIYVVGGKNDVNEFVYEIECYDPSLDEWKIVAASEEKLDDHSIVAI